MVYFAANNKISSSISGSLVRWFCLEGKIDVGQTWWCCWRFYDHTGNTCAGGIFSMISLRVMMMMKVIFKYANQFRGNWKWNISNFYKLTKRGTIPSSVKNMTIYKTWKSLYFLESLIINTHHFNVMFTSLLYICTR